MDLTAGQIANLQKVLEAGFRFVTLERYGRYFGIERDGFAILIDPAEGRLRTFGQAGYLIGDGIGMLVERGGAKEFVWHRDSVAATQELLAAYERFRSEVGALFTDEP